MRRAWCSTTPICSQIDKYSGWDRVEGGSRANVGLQYTAQVNRAGSLNVLFGQSYSLFGQNSFAGRRYHQYRPRIAASTRPFRTMSAASPISRIESIRSPRAGASTSRPSRRSVSRSKAAPISTAGRCSSSTATTRAQPRTRLPDAPRGHSRRRIVQGDRRTGSCSARARYDIVNDQFDQTRLGLGYVDDCFMLSLNWLTGYTYTADDGPGHATTRSCSSSACGRWDQMS